MTATVARGGQREIVRLVSVCMVTQDLERLAEFYRGAFGCNLAADERLPEADSARLRGVRAGARHAVLTLGAQRIELLQFDVPGQVYPAGLSASDLRFQHFAIVVEDMRRAYEHLQRIGGWTSISTSGPQRLPASSGGVMAFKFRDPDGHPLELLDLAGAAGSRSPQASQPQPAPSQPLPLQPSRPPLFRGIDHSAISVSDSTRSIAFYEALGLRVSSRSLNRGHEQQQLDGLAHAEVQVVGLSPHDSPPHLELLCYQRAAAGGGARAAVRAVAVQPQDVAATRLVFASRAHDAGRERAQPLQLLDPDGHRLLVD